MERGQGFTIFESPVTNHLGSLLDFIGCQFTICFNQPQTIRAIQTPILIFYGLFFIFFSYICSPYLYLWLLRLLQNKQAEGEHTETVFGMSQEEGGKQCR